MREKMTDKDKTKEYDDKWLAIRKRADELAPGGVLSSENFEKFTREVLDKFEEINKKKTNDQEN